MNYLLPVLFFLLTAATATAKQAHTIICGHFAGSAPVSVTLQYYASPMDVIEGKNTKIEQIVDKDKKFKFELITEHPLNFHLLRDEDWIFINKYIGPGDSLNFVFNDSSINVAGNCEECLGFQFAYDNKYNNKDSMKSLQDAGMLAPYAFADFMKRRHDAHLAYFDEYFKGKKYPDAFKQYFTSDEDLYFAINMVQYSWRSKNGKTALLDTAYWAYLSGIDVSHPVQQQSTRYEDFLRELPYGIWTTLEKNGNSKYYMANAPMIKDSIARSFFKDRAYDLALYHILNDELRNLDQYAGQAGFNAQYKKTDALITKLGSHFTNQLFLGRLKRRLADTKLVNVPAPDFTVQDLNGKMVKLSDLKGKVVYIDFWSTSCVPCIEELPYIKKMQEKYKDNKNLVLLYIAFDDKETVEKFTKDKAFNGTHWVDPKGFASEAAKKYNITSLPRYLLIDKKGMLINRNAPRPSNSPYEMIDNLLENNN